MALTKIQAAGLTADLIDETKLADNSLDSEHYNDGSIDHEHLANDAVDADILADNSVGLAAMAHATDGVIITFDANGAPVYVGPGTDGQVLTSTGAGSPPAFENAASGGISDVVSDTSPQLGGNLDVNGKNIVFADSSGASDDRLTLGADTDLIIYHDGNSYVTNSTATQLAVQSNDLKLRSFTDLENYLVCTHNGSVDIYYNGSKKFETNSTGCKTWGSHIFTNGGSVTGGDLGFADSSKAQFGDDNDLQIYHNGHSYVANNAGDLYLVQATDQGNGIFLEPKPSEAGIKIFRNGAVELYYDNSKKFETNAYGVKAIGHIYADDDYKVQLGSGQDLTLYHNGTNSLIENGTGELLIRAKTGENSINCNPDGSVELYHDNSKKFETTSSGAKITGKLEHAGIVQVVSNVYQGNRMTTSSNSYVEAWSGLTITPVSSSSKVLVRCTGTCFTVSGSATMGIILRREVGGSITETSPIGNGGHGSITSPDGATIGTYQGDDGSSNIYQIPFSIEWVDSPSTTSAVTYELWIASNNSSATVGIGGRGDTEGDNTTTTMVAMEIGA